MIRCLFYGVVLVQSCTHELNTSELYVATCARKKGVVGGVLSHFGNGGCRGLYAVGIGVYCTNGGEGRVWRCAIKVAFFWIVWCISAMNASIELTDTFDGEL